MAERRTTAHTQDIRKRRPMCSKMLMSRKNKTAHRFSRYRHKKNKSPYTSKQRYTHKHSYRKKNKKRGGSRVESLKLLFTIVGHLNMYSSHSMMTNDIEEFTFSRFQTICNNDPQFVSYLPSDVKTQVNYDIQKFKNLKIGTKDNPSFMRKIKDKLHSTNDKLTLHELGPLVYALDECQLRKSKLAMKTLPTKSNFYRDLNSYANEYKKDDFEKNILMMLCFCKESTTPIMSGYITESEYKEGLVSSSDVRNYTALSIACDDISSHIVDIVNYFNELKTLAFSANKHTFLEDPFQQICAKKLLDTTDLTTLCQSTKDLLKTRITELKELLQFPFSDFYNDEYLSQLIKQNCSTNDDQKQHLTDRLKCSYKTGWFYSTSGGGIVCTLDPAFFHYVPKLINNPKPVGIAISCEELEKEDQDTYHKILHREDNFFVTADEEKIVSTFKPRLQELIASLKIRWRQNPTLSEEERIIVSNFKPHLQDAVNERIAKYNLNLLKEEKERGKEQKRNTESETKTKTSFFTTIKKRVR